MRHRNFDGSPRSVSSTRTRIPAIQGRKRKTTYSFESSTGIPFGKAFRNNVVSFPVPADRPVESEQPSDQIPVLNDPVIVDAQKPIAQQPWKPQYIVPAVAGAVALMLVVILTLSSDRTSNTESVAQLETTTAATLDALSTLRVITDELNTTANWDEAKLNQFLQQWAALDVDTKRSLTDKAWYLRFTFALQQQVKQQIQVKYSEITSIDDQPLLKLAVMLGVMDVNGIRASAVARQSKYRELIDALKTEIAMAETATTDTDTAIESEIRLNELFKKKMAGKTVSITRQKPIVPDVAHKTVVKKDLVQKRAKPEAISTVAQAQQSLSSPIQKQPVQNTVSAVELEQLVNDFVRSYESGNIEQFTALFSPKARTNDQSNIDGIKKDYVELFGNTSHRLINIFNLRWKNEKNIARGIGDLEVAVAVKNPNTVRTLHGKVQIAVEKVNGKILITHLYHIER